MAAATPPPPTPMAPVVGPQFCDPSVVELDIKKDLSFSRSDYFSISGVNNGILMKVKGRFFRKSKCVLYDAAGFPIISMKRKRATLGYKWNTYRGDSDDQKDLLFTVRRSNIFQPKTELDVFLAANTTEQHCDFKVKKRWFRSSYTFYLGESNTVVALMSRQYELFSSRFRATVYPNIDYAFVIAITVILDDMGQK